MQTNTRPTRRLGIFVAGDIATACRTRRDEAQGEGGEAVTDDDCTDCMACPCPCPDCGCWVELHDMRGEGARLLCQACHRLKEEEDEANRCRLCGGKLYDGDGSLCIDCESDLD